MHTKQIKQTGFTLTELMIVIAILGTLAAIAAPSFNSVIERQRLVSASEAILSDLRWARSEAIKQNEEVRVTYTTGGTWSYTINVDPSGDNTQIKSVSSTNFRSTSMSAAAFSGVAYTTFDPVRGTASNGTVTITTTNYSLSNKVSTLGRIHVCGTIGDYTAC